MCHSFFIVPSNSGWNAKPKKEVFPSFFNPIFLVNASSTCPKQDNICPCTSCSNMLPHLQMETFTLFAILLQQLSPELAAKAGWVEGYHTLLSTLFALRHSDLCLSAHSSVMQDRECLVERAHSTWQSRMPPAEEPAVAPVHKKAEEEIGGGRRCWQTKQLSAPVDLSLANS